MKIDFETLCGQTLDIDMSSVSTYELSCPIECNEEYLDTRIKKENINENIQGLLVGVKRDNLQSFIIINTISADDFFSKIYKQKNILPVKVNYEFLRSCNGSDEYIPYVYILKNDQNSSDKPKLLLAVNVAYTTAYILKKNVQNGTGWPLNKKTKINTGYFLADKNGNLFVLDRETWERFYPVNESGYQDYSKSGEIYCVDPSFYNMDNGIWHIDRYPDNIIRLDGSKNPPKYNFETKECSFDYAETEKYSKCLSEWNRNAEKVYEEAKQLKASGKLEDAFKKFSLAATFGHPYAMEKKALALYRGDGVAKDFTKAFVAFKTCAEQGLTNATLVVGRMCEYGQGTGADLQKAKLWYKKAKKLGSEKADSEIRRVEAKIAKK